MDRNEPAAGHNGQVLLTTVRQMKSALQRASYLDQTRACDGTKSLRQVGGMDVTVIVWRDVFRYIQIAAAPKAHFDSRGRISTNRVEPGAILMAAMPSVCGRA